jgi:DNA-binding HxlR family transcriptional regulator
MKRSDNKSHCPVNFALESFGDPWSLLIVRDIVFFGKKTYGEFLDSAEGIATNVLASRLVQLEQRGILVKLPNESDKRKDVYALTEKGLGLIPILLEMAGWSACHDRETVAPKKFVAAVYEDREKMFKAITDAVRSGKAVFGPDGLVQR